MQSFLKSVQVLMFACFMAFLLWNDLFPLSAHSDLRFQVVGEALELFTFIATFGWLHLAVAKSRKRAISDKASYAANIESAIASMLIFAVMDWRKFFPADHLQFSAGLNTFIFALLAGAFLGFYGVPSNGDLKRPSNEEERSVV